MEEELSYSTVVFNHSGQTTKANEDFTVYSTVKTENGTANTGPQTSEASADHSTDKCANLALDPAPTSSHSHHVRLLLVCSGILCGIVLLSISVIIHLSVRMNEEKANSEAKLSNLTAANQLLTAEKSNLQKDADNLNWTLGVILTFDTFPVNTFCPQKECQPCQSGWIRFQDKCYLFYDQPAPWKTWTQSRQYCKDKNADLVVIDSLQEQEFTSANIKYYYDFWHGFWTGLNKAANTDWRWLDGRNVTLEYWRNTGLYATPSCAQMLPKGNSTANWNPSDCEMQNKFICETDVLIREQ